MKEAGWRSALQIRGRIDRRGGETKCWSQATRVTIEIKDDDKEEDEETGGEGMDGVMGR